MRLGGTPAAASSSDCTTEGEIKKIKGQTKHGLIEQNQTHEGEGVRWSNLDSQVEVVLEDPAV